MEAAVSAFKADGFEVEEVDDALLQAARPAWNVLMSAELCNNVSRFDGVKYGHRASDYDTIDDLYTNSRTEAFGDVLKTAILYGSEMLSEENYEKMYDKSLRVRRVIVEEFVRLFDSYDAVLLPACGKSAYAPADVAADKHLCFKENAATAPASITGLPAVVAGGVQLVGPRFPRACCLRSRRNSKPLLRRCANALRNRHRLEVHVELATDSKIFCSCANRSGDEQNSHVCPACCGMPGMLPIVNKRAVDLGITAGRMLNCHINRVTTFDKKSYYYPDLPCSYQTTQWFSPVAVDGAVRIETENGPKDIRIKQIHMEEDAGKLVHDTLSNTTLVDFNRTSAPLIEIVSQPDLSSADEVVAYLERLRSLLRFAKVSECRMELGTMRCDVNVSVRPEGSAELGVRTEMKNMNSISAIRRAIAFEQDRHIDAIENGTEELVQETRRWDDEQGMSFAMRNKGDRGRLPLFPDPNVMPIVIDDAWYDRIDASLPPFPEVKKQQLMDEGLTEYDADLLVGSRVLCDCFDEAYRVSGLAKECANWIGTNCLALFEEERSDRGRPRAFRHAPGRAGEAGGRRRGQQREREDHPRGHVRGRRRRSSGVRRGS